MGDKYTTMEKTLTMREALIALAEGKKITNTAWKKGYYIYINEGHLINNNGAHLEELEVFCNYELYTDPKEHEVTLYECLGDISCTAILDRDWETSPRHSYKVTSCSFGSV